MNALFKIATPEELTSLRLQLRSNGYYPVPVIGAHINMNAAGKRPSMRAWATECFNATPEKITNWSLSQRNCTNTGILCGELIGIDIDVLNDVLASGLVARTVELLGPSPLRRIGRAPKTLLLYRVETPHKKLATPDLIFGDDADKKDDRARVEILADGQQFVAFGIHPDTHAPYRWPERSPLDTAASEIPLVTFEALKQFVDEAEQFLRAAGGRTAREIKSDTKSEQSIKEPRREQRERHEEIAPVLWGGERPSRELVSDALDRIPNDMDYDGWIRIGFALYEGLGESGRDLWERWSAQSHKNDPQLTAQKWPSFAAGNSITIGTLFWHAAQNGWRSRSVDNPLGDKAALANGQIDDCFKLPFGYRFRDDGLYWIDPDPEKPELMLAGCFDIVAETRDGDGTSWGVLLEWKDRDGRQHRYALPKATLAGDGSEARKALLDGGLFVSPVQKARTQFNAFLLQVRSRGRARATQRVGWHGLSFVLPDESFGEADGDKLLLQTNTAHEHTFRQSGTLESWQENVARYAIGNGLLVLALSAAFAGPLIGPCSAEGGGIHFRGASSTGKSTALHVAGSVWGGGGVKGFLRSWRSTSNGLEGVALSHCDTLLCLDELSELPSREAGDAAYMLANGSGKARSARDGSARRSASWRTLFLSSGEIGLADKIAEDGRSRRMAAGQAVRIVDVAADAGAGMGILEELHEFPSPDALARHLTKAAQHHYGVAARAYLKAIVPIMTDLQNQVADITALFSIKYVPPGADGQVERVARRFALIAAGGEIATRAGVLPWERGEAVIAAANAFEAWMVARGGSAPAEEREGIETVRAFLLANGMARFIPAWDDAKFAEARMASNLPPPARIAARDVAGYRQMSGDAWDYYVTPSAWKEICAGLDPRRTASVMAAKGHLVVAEKEHLTKSMRIPNFGKQRVYHVVAAFLEGDDNA
ncbi:DUF927 domain-containing protein [Bradyrhizobium sp. BR13661]|uniref:DUF927 domain-containing protein n=1 Tax=Bradyrhizobium sp. BR13661 TaxID=2940622 RepID=UPI0024759BF8|nr:DUF927 domain-containing protein [Bradyrhizobium sp. BR13661]MDH6259075.1 uncharacterized protein (DUF927 family) [Bradyrhizobium sp. BR13661]